MLTPTARGCYAAVCAADVPLTRRIVFALLREPATAVALAARLGGRIGDRTRQLLPRMLETGLLEAGCSARQCPAGALDEVLPRLLATLAVDGRALLCDQAGLAIGVHGFDAAAAAQLAALSAVLLEAGDRHRSVFRDVLGIRTLSWGVLDGDGRTRLGIWPINLGGQRCALVLHGRPNLAQPAFIDLVSVLAHRYETPA